jgi:hypothetical protein
MGSGSQFVLQSGVPEKDINMVPKKAMPKYVVAFFMIIFLCCYTSFCFLEQIYGRMLPEIGTFEVKRLNCGVKRLFELVKFLG